MPTAISLALGTASESAAKAQVKRRKTKAHSSLWALWQLNILQKGTDTLRLPIRENTHVLSFKHVVKSILLYKIFET